MDSSVSISDLSGDPDTGLVILNAAPKSRYRRVFAFRLHEKNGDRGLDRTRVLGLSSATPYPLGHHGEFFQQVE